MRLLTLAALPALAASAHALTLDVQGGFGKASHFDNDGTYAVSLGTAINDELSIGVTYLHANLDTQGDAIFGDVNSNLKAYTLDLTYDLSRGGLGTFVGVGAGQATLAGSDIDSTQNGIEEFCAVVFVGTRFEISQNVDFTLTARYTRVFGVSENANFASSEQDIGHWSGLAGLRFKF
ncbi:MAG: outer membrane beta-barrel protein [Opitutia bacterium]